MSKISALSNYLKEASLQKFSFGDTSVLIPPEERLYLNKDGTIPNTNKKPMELKPPIVPEQGKRKGLYIDKRMFLKLHSKEFETSHSPDKTNISYGGIFINKDGMILMRKPKGEFGGQRWTFAKGGADKGESPEEAALREVEEETGIKGNIISEIPGHYNSTNSSNKYFLMEADIDDDHIKSFKSDETEELKWMSYTDALEALKNNDNKESSKRDRQVLSTARNLSNQKSKQKSLGEHFTDYFDNQRDTLAEDMQVTADYFVKNSKLPDDLKANPTTAMILTNVAQSLVSPSKNPNEDVSEFLPTIFKALDKKHGLDSSTGYNELHLTILKEWGASASQSSDIANLMQEVLGEKYNIPHTYMYGKNIAPDVDASGKPTYRTDAQRDEIIEKYEKYKNADYQEAIDSSSGLYSWGESYDFSSDEQIDFSHKTSTGELITKQVDPHKLMYERAVSVKKARGDILESGYSREADRNELLDKYGNAYIKNVLNEDPSTYSEESIRNNGNNYLSSYIDHMQTINKQLLDSMYPDTDHLIMWRKTTGPTEIVGKHGLKGSQTVDPTLFGMPENTSPNDEGWRVKVHSSPVAGGSINPTVWSGEYAIASKVNKNDFLILHPFMYPSGGNSHQSEKESIYVVNTNETDSRVIKQSGAQFSANSESGGWADFGNGFAPLNLFGTYKDKGITAPNTDYYKENLLSPATSDDSPFITPANNGKFGSNAGGLKKDNKGNLFYIKHENPERNKSEVFATNIYKEAGINVPDVELINYNGTLATKSKWLDNPITHTAFSDSPPEQLLNSPDVKDGFFIDALLANHDVAGENYDNFVESNGKIYRVDNGGSLMYRAKSNEPKQNYQYWHGEDIEELSSMMDTQYNSGKIFSTMTDDDIKKASNNLFKLSDSKLDAIAEDSGYQFTDATILKQRRDSIINWLVKNKGDVINHSSVNSVKDEYNIMKSEIFKADAVQKQIPELFFGDNSGRHTEKTPEEQKEIDEHNERMSKLYEDEWERLDNL